MPSINLTPRKASHEALKWTGENLLEVKDFCHSLRFDSGRLILFCDPEIQMVFIRDGTTYSVVETDQDLDTLYEGREEGIRE